MPWECENERHAYEKSVYTHPLVTRQLTLNFPCAQVPVRGVSLNRIPSPFRPADHEFPQLYASHEGTLEEEACRVRVRVTK